MPGCSWSGASEDAAGSGLAKSGLAKSGLAKSGLVSLLDPAPVLHGGDVVIGVLRRALRQLHLRPLDLLVGQQADQVADAVESRMLLRIGAHDVPRRPGRVRGVQHLVAGAGVFVPEPA